MDRFVMAGAFSANNAMRVRIVRVSGHRKAGEE